MTWNYRVIEFVTPEGEPWRSIHEVYYHTDGTPWLYSENPAGVVWDEGLDEAHEILKRMQEALAKPVLVERDFEREAQC